MKAVQLIAHGVPGRFELGQVPDQQPAASEAVVRVQACGLNRLDLWLEEGGLPMPLQFPRPPGCEIAGRIVAVGSNGGAWQAGDRVAVQSNLWCGRCEYCSRGEESQCLNNVTLGVQRDGGFAEAVVVPVGALVKLPENVAFETSAALTLAGSTAMHMLTHRALAKPGDWGLVMAGASGVGSAAIQIARQLGARVISTGSTEAKRALAKKLGAEFVADPANEAWTGEVRNVTGRRGVDLVIEHGGGAAVGQVVKCLARGGGGGALGGCARGQGFLCRRC